MSSAVVASMVWPPLLYAAVGTAAFLWVLRWVARGYLTIRTPLDGAIVPLVVMGIISLGITTLPAKTLTQVFRLLSGIALYYAISNWDISIPRLRALGFGIGLAGILLALFSTVSVVWTARKFPWLPLELYERFAILVSDTVNPSVMAGSLVILLPIVLAWLLFAWPVGRWRERILMILSCLAILLVLGLTQARGAFLALGAVLVSLVILRWHRGWIVITLVVIVALGAIGIFGTARFSDALSAVMQVQGLQDRTEIWSRALFMVQDFPYTGVGMGSFLETANLLYPFFSFQQSGAFHAHNLFLQIAADLGIPGLVAWLAIWLVLTAVSWQIYRAGRLGGDPLALAFGAGLLCSQIALVLHGLTDAVTWGIVRSAPIVWALWGVVVAAYRMLVLSAQGSTPLSDPIRP